VRTKRVSAKRDENFQFPEKRSLSSVEPAEGDRDSRSEGWGETTSGATQKLMLLLMSLSNDSWYNMGTDSTFIDFGSGFGKVVIHAKLAVGVKLALGIEYVMERATPAIECLDTLKAAGSKQNRTLFMTDEAGELLSHGCSLEGGDATKNKLNFSHVYMYDKVFNPVTRNTIARILNKASYRVLISYKNWQTWHVAGLRNFKCVNQIKMRTTGTECYTAFIYINTRRSFTLNA